MNKNRIRNSIDSVRKQVIRTTGLVLVLFIVLSSSSRVEAQDFSDEDHITTFGVLLGATLCAVVGAVSISQNVYTSAKKIEGLSEAELIEAKDQLLDYRANEESNLKDYQLAYLYPMLHKFMKRLKRDNLDYRSKTNDELIDIAAKELLSGKE